MSSGESAKVELVCPDSIWEEKTGGSGVQGCSPSELKKSVWLHGTLFQILFSQISAEFPFHKTTLKLSRDSFIFRIHLIKYQY